MLVMIDRFLRKTGISASRFGRIAANDPRLVFDLRNGREPGAAMIGRIRQAIRQEDER